MLTKKLGFCKVTTQIQGRFGAVLRLSAGGWLQFECVWAEMEGSDLPSMAWSSGGVEGVRWRRRAPLVMWRWRWRWV